MTETEAKEFMMKEKTQLTYDTTGILHHLEALLSSIHNAQESASAAVAAMEPFPELDNERRRLEGILGVLGSMAYSAQSSPLVPQAMAPGEFNVSAPS